MLSTREQKIEVKHNADRILRRPPGQFLQKRYRDDGAVEFMRAELPAVRIL
jgi:hypothetical protein